MTIPQVFIFYISCLDVTVEKFYMVDFMSLCDLPDDRFMPCEMGLVEYSLQYGIIRSFHKFIYPGNYLFFYHKTLAAAIIL